MSIFQDIQEIKSGKIELRKFGLTVGGVFAVLGGWIFWRHGAAILPYSFLGAGAFLIVFGALIPAALLPIQKIWMTLAVCMGFVMTRVLLTVLYYVVLTPIGLFLRLTGKDVIDRAPKREAASYWKDHAEPDAQGPYRQF